MNEARMEKLRRRQEAAKKYKNPYAGMFFEYPNELESNEMEPMPATFVVSIGSPQMEGGITITMSPEAEGTLESMKKPVVDRLKATTAAQLQCQIMDIDIDNDIHDFTIGDGVPGKEFILRSAELIVPGPTGMPVSLQLLFWNVYTVLNGYMYVIQLVASNEDALAPMVEITKGILATVHFEEPNPKVEKVCAILWKELYLEDSKLSLKLPTDWKVEVHAKDSAGAAGEDLVEDEGPGPYATRPSAQRLVDMKWHCDSKHKHYLHGMLVLEDLPAYTELEEYSRLSKVQLQKGLIPLLTVSSRTKTLAGFPAKEYTYSPKHNLKITRRLTVLGSSNRALVASFDATNAAELAPEPVFEGILESVALNEEAEWSPSIPDGMLQYEHFVSKLSFLFPESFQYQGDASIGFVVTSKKHPGLEFSLTAVKRELTDTLEDVLMNLEGHYQQMGNVKMYSESAKIAGMDGRELMYTGQSMQMDGTMGPVEQRMTRAAQKEQTMYLLTFAAAVDKFSEHWDSFGKSMMNSFTTLDD